MAPARPSMQEVGVPTPSIPVYTSICNSRQRTGHAICDAYIIRAERKISTAMSSRSSLAQDTSQRTAAEVQDQPIASVGSQPLDAEKSADLQDAGNDVAPTPAEDGEPENTAPQDAEQQTEDPATSAFLHVCLQVKIVQFSGLGTFFGCDIAIDQLDRHAPTCTIQTAL